MTKIREEMEDFVQNNLSSIKQIMNHIEENNIGLAKTKLTTLERQSLQMESNLLHRAVKDHVEKTKC